MRYLYGDSVAFPLQYNFLAALETFLTGAARAVQLDAEIVQARAQAAAAADARTRSIQALEKFHQALMQVVQQGTEETTDAVTLEYKRQVREFGTRLVDEGRRQMLNAGEQEATALRSTVDRLRSGIRGAIEGFLRTGLLPVQGWSVSMMMADARNELTAVLINPEGIVTSFKLSTAQVPVWEAPVRVSTFMQGLDLQTGIRKRLMSRSVERDVERLDEYYFGGFELGDDTAEIRLRKKPDQRDTLVFRLRRIDDAIDAEMERPGMEDVDASLNTVLAEDRRRLEKLWSVLRTGVKDVLVHRDRLLSVTLDGTDLFEEESLKVFIERFVKLLAPVVTEIASRSPNPDELSLKVEREAGRREEIYVRRADLASKLDGLDPAGRSVFDPLGLAPKDALTAADVTVD